MILRDPYQFKFLHLLNNADVVNNINNYIVTEYGYLKDTQLFQPKEITTDIGSIKPVILYGLTAAEQHIPSFNHPIYSTKNKWIALDLRQLVKKDPATGKAVVRNVSDYSLVTLKFILTCNWFAGKESMLYTLKLPHIAYAEWLSTNITRKFGLNMTEQVQLFVLAAIYYATLFTNTFEADDVQKLTLRLKNEIFVQNLFDDVIAKCGTLNSIDDFCKACYSVTESPRLKGFDTAVLMNIMPNNWFSVAGNELAVLSLCHPPTWISLVYSSLVSKTYKSCYIAKVVEDKNKRGSGAEFLKELEVMIKSQTGVSHD